MFYQEAINTRCSRRTYLPKPVDYGCINKLRSLIDEYNQKAGLNMQLALNHSEAFDGLLKSYGMFKGAKNYIGLIESENDPFSREKLGYYGELLVLEATDMRLGTCWVGGTFDRKRCPFVLSDHEKITCVITFGNVPSERSMREKLIFSMTHRKSKTADELYEADAPLPGWFRSGINAVQKAPSAVNRQPVKFAYKNNIVTASVKDINTSSMALDLGIAKLHFELGAGGGIWEWGNGAVFQK
jgi:nitroreductase